MTALDLITASLKRIGVVGAGQTPSADDAVDGLLRLNALIDSFATERLTVPSITRTTFPIVSGTGAYTVGVGGTVNVARPVFIQDVRILDTTPNPDLEIALEMLTDQSYANISQKATTSVYPTAWYWNPTYSGAGFGALTFWPVPTSTTLLGVLYAPAALGPIAALTTTLLLAPGYQHFLQERLALVLAPEWGVEPPRGLLQSANEATSNVKRGNIRLIELATTIGYAMGGRPAYDINSDT